MTICEHFYDDLLSHFGRQHWWPVTPSTPSGLAAWEVAVGAILTQNTNWINVEKALAALIAADRLGPEYIVAMDVPALAALIRPSGYFNVKAKRLQALAEWWLDRYAWASKAETPRNDLREELLAVHGVGPETADSILLYAFGRPCFVVDAYTRRILRRHGLVSDRAAYAEVQEYLIQRLPEDVELYKEFHALLVVLAKEFCRAGARCEGCPLHWHQAQAVDSDRQS